MFMNDLDFHNRTRTFFSEIRSKYRASEEMVPIRNRNEQLSTTCSETLKNWSEYYENLYSLRRVKVEAHDFPTPDGDPQLDNDLTKSELVDTIYKLKNHKSPGFDHISNDDITSAILEEMDTSDDEVPSQQKIVLIEFIFSILTNFWFNGFVPREFKRTVLRPF